MNIKSILMATVIVGAALGGVSAANAASETDLNRDSAAALQHLYETNPAAAAIAHKARAVLIFPSIVKAGLVFGGAYGDGELLQGQ